MDEKLYADLAAATKYYLIGNEFEDRIQKENNNIQTLSAYPENNKRKKTESSILMCKIGKWIAIPNGIFLLLCGIVAMAGVEPDASDKILLPIMGFSKDFALRKYKTKIEFAGPTPPRAHTELRFGDFSEIRFPILGLPIL